MQRQNFITLTEIRILQGSCVVSPQRYNWPNWPNWQFYGGYEETYCDARIDRIDRIDHYTEVLGKLLGCSIDRIDRIDHFTRLLRRGTVTPELTELTELTILQGSCVGPLRRQNWPNWSNWPFYRGPGSTYWNARIDRIDRIDNFSGVTRRTTWGK